VVASTPPPADLVEVLLAKHPAPIAVVVAGEVDGAPCVIDCQPDSLTITDLDLSCVPQDLDANTLEAMLRLLESTDEPADEALDELREDDPAPLQAEVDGETAEEDFVDAEEVLDLRDTPAVPTDQPQLFPMPVTSNGHQPADEDGELDYEVLVRLLGPIRIEGCKQLRPKPTAVVAYLALHRSVTIEVLEDACWADASSDALRKRLKDVVSECRGALSAENLPVAADGRYTVGPRVVTDTMLFDRQVARAANQPPERQADSYRAALELVTGKVFSYPSRAGSSFAWIDTENLLSQWEHKIQAIAQQCVETYLALGEHEQAIEVANHVLQALPLNTPLTEALMRAHAATGDIATVDTVYRAHTDGLVRVLNTDPDDSTSDLHRQLVAAS
jgi:DNA-binding SARP family transcriptional activator